jgi:hypothetical protein
MNRKALAAYIVIAFIVSAIAAIAGFSRESWEITKVRDSAFGVRMRPAVAFNHDEHNEKAAIDDCMECHHDYDENGEKMDYSTEDWECSECHMDEGKTRMDLMRAYHLNCKGCHEDEKAGPVMCGECHLKE